MSSIDARPTPQSEAVCGCLGSRAGCAAGAESLSNGSVAAPPPPGRSLDGGGAHGGEDADLCSPHVLPRAQHHLPRRHVAANL